MIALGPLPMSALPDPRHAELAARMHRVIARDVAVPSDFLVADPRDPAMRHLPFENRKSKIQNPE